MMCSSGNENRMSVICAFANVSFLTDTQSSFLAHSCGITASHPRRSLAGLGQPYLNFPQPKKAGALRVPPKPPLFSGKLAWPIADSDNEPRQPHRSQRSPLQLVLYLGFESSIKYMFTARVRRLFRHWNPPTTAGLTDEDLARFDIAYVEPLTMYDQERMLLEDGEVVANTAIINDEHRIESIPCKLPSGSSSTAFLR